nr:bifunctional glycosyltransferase family 2 protein/class I SAM-dependent methyltransferase [Clostridioides difficile]
MNIPITVSEKSKDIIKNWQYTCENNDIKFTSIIILTYNQIEYTKLCIESIRKFTPKNKYEIIIIDNNSSDGTVDWLKEQSDIKSVYNNKNLGFPKGCNQGIELAKGENILLLNNDVIVTPNWLYNLDKALWSQDNIGAVGPITNACSYYQQINVDYKSIEEMFLFAQEINKSNINSWKYRVKLVGFCMLIKKSVLDNVGVLDELFTPGNFEDDDLSFRMLEEGYKLILCQDTFIHHFGSVSFKENRNKYTDIMDINRRKFKTKWGFNSEYSGMIRTDLISEIDCDVEKNINVLEIGCGIGATLLEIKNIYKNSSVYGIEISESAGKLAKNIGDVLIADIEKVQLDYKKNFFDYIILGDVLEHLVNPWKIVNDLKRHLKKDGNLISSIPNIMHVSVLRNLVQGNFTYTDSGILDKTHLRFFTLNEILRMFNDSNYIIDGISATKMNLSEADNRFIDTICKESNENVREQYECYQYIVKASNCVDTKRYSSVSMVNLKYALMRIDNELDIDDNLSYIFDNYNITDQGFIDDIEYLVDMFSINKTTILNRLGAEAFNRGIGDFSISMFMMALNIDRDNIDTIYNITSVLCDLEEFEIAYDLIKNSSEKVQSESDIQEILYFIEGRKKYE